MLTYVPDYFMRVHSLDPNNTMVNLSIALGYLHHAFKRQSENRQYLILQGFSFLFQYYDARLKAAGERGEPGTVVEMRQEAHYNVARSYDLLGLHHLAVEYYRRVLEEEASGMLPQPSGQGAMEVDGGSGGDEKRESDGMREDMVLEAATNLRTYCLLTGDVAAARAITNDWLVL